MNILVISSILYLPPAINGNDFIYHLYDTYRKQYKNVKVVIICPVKYDFNILTILKGRTRLQKLKGQLKWRICDFQVEVFPFLSAWSIRNLHALVSRSIYFVNWRRIRNLFKTIQFDIIHARFIFADGLLAYQISKKHNIPYCVSTHDELFYFRHFYSKKMALKILNNASFILPVSYTNMIMFKSLGIEKVSQLTHGIYNKFIKPQRKEPNDKVRILTVCRLLKYKNVDKVIFAIDRLKKRNDFTYTIIGTGPERNHLENMVQTLDLENMVNFIDGVPHNQIADEMYKYDIFILPSYFETFGRVYFEAMAMGIPIICAKNSGVFGVFKEKLEGLSVDHTNIQEIADTLVFLIVDKDARLGIGKNGQDLVKKYTWNNIAHRLHQTYENCIVETKNELQSIQPV